uniref:Uncharacterized protein n=1 Tax=Arundo donax TaxID=35708 RepID=A0A0A9B969_ARUDO
MISQHFLRSTFFTFWSWLSSYILTCSIFFTCIEMTN